MRGEKSAWFRREPLRCLINAFTTRRRVKWIKDTSNLVVKMEKSCIQKEESTQKSVINRPTSSPPFFSFSFSWRFGSSSLVWWQCPWHTLSSYNGLIVIPSTLKVETFIKWSLSLSLSHSQPFPLLPCLFRVALSLLVLHSISITRRSVVSRRCTPQKLLTAPLPRFKLLFLLCLSRLRPAELVQRSPAARRAHSCARRACSRGMFECECLSSFVRVIKQYPSFSPKQTALFKMQRIQRRRY